MGPNKQTQSYIHVHVHVHKLQQHKRYTCMHNMTELVMHNYVQGKSKLFICL